MDDEIIHSWCFHDVECFDSTPSATIIILDKDLESFSSLRSQHDLHQKRDREVAVQSSSNGGKVMRRSEPDHDAIVV